jgi:hypothetical protein
MKLETGKALLAIASAVILATGCGGSGSGGGSNGGGAGTQASATAASQIIGTTATGAALANASVAVTDSSGASPCVEAVITTSALGSYTCTLQAGKSAPFFVVVTDPTGNTPPMVSVTTVTPPAGAPLTLNVTPLTTAIVAQLGGGDALAVVNSKTVNAADLQAVTSNVVAQLASVLASVGAPAGYDPFTTSITAATADGTGNTADMVLDVIKVTTDPATGQLALATVDNPTPVLLATASSTGATVPSLDPAVSSLSQAAQIAAKKFNECFALPTAQRVLHQDPTIPQSQGGPEVDDVGAACYDFVSDSTNAGGIDYMHNGYWAGQQFYGILTSDTMTGAQFSVPEIMAFYPKDSSAPSTSPAFRDRAVLNIRYLDADGNPGNIVTVAALIPGSSSAARPTEWWLVGNQQAVDVAVKLTIRRVEQLNPGGTPAATANFSTFQTGVQFSVNAKGPGSSNVNGPLTYARISGPGLPGNGAAGTGLVYKVSTNTAQDYMDLYGKDGVLGGTQCGGGVPFNCPNLWFARTRGISGADATTLTSNPTGLGGFIWAQAADGVDPTRFVKGAKYKVELFYGSNTGLADVVLTKTLLSDLVQATQAVNLPWNTPGSQTMAALDPNGPLAGSQSALPLDWIQNISAQQVGGAQAFVSGGSFGPTKFVPRGATSVVLNNQTVPAFTSTSLRGVLFGYRMLDTSNKTAVYRYN